MLPPQSNNYRSYLITQMKRIQRNTSSPISVHKVNYVNLLRDLFESMPQANVNRRWTVDELCKQLPGRYNEKPAQRMIASALRELGFTQHRDWTNAGRNRRFWKPTFFNFKE